jgi:predicted DCC family thiol-disulfide oxidoreductase YuxK
LPDSIVLDAGEGELLVESDAVVQLLAILGGYWRILGIVLGIVPRPIRNAGYRTIAKYRRRVFGSATDACPLMPADLRDRFELD